MRDHAGIVWTIHALEHVCMFQYPCGGWFLSTDARKLVNHYYESCSTMQRIHQLAHDMPSLHIHMYLEGSISVEIGVAIQFTIVRVWTSPGSLVGLAGSLQVWNQQANCQLYYILHYYCQCCVDHGYLF